MTLAEIRWDVDLTVALWMLSRITANDALYNLTGNWRRYASWDEVKGVMFRWQCRREFMPETIAA